MVGRHEKPLGAIVSTDDMRRLEATGAATDLRDAHAALAEAKDAGTVPVDMVLKKYGLDHLLAAPASAAPRARRNESTRARAKRSRKTSTDRRLR